MDTTYIDKRKFLTEQYRKIGLSEKQLIILLLCINDDVVFRIDYDKIKQVMDLTPECVTKELSGLFQKNLLTVTLSKVDGEHVEVFDSSRMFTLEEIKDETNIFAEIEHCFGKSLSSREVEKISKWISTNKFQYNDILDAFGIAAINNVKNINYVEKVLENNATSEVKEEITPLNMKYNWLEDE